MATKKIEIQDSNGNVYYPHTDASVVKNGSKTVAEQLNEIENNKATGKVRLLNNDNISLLGLTLPCTCQQLAEAMENGDVLFADDSIISDAPTDFGQLFVIRENSSRVSFQYRKAGDSSNIAENFMYIAYYRSLSVNKFSGWRLVLTEDKIVNNLSATTNGFLLDARQGKILYDKSIFFKGGTYNSTVDLNGYLNNGEWYFSNESGFVNAPNNLKYFMLTVHGNGTNKVIQEITNVLPPFEKYYRVYNNGTFNSWYKITSTTI